MNHDAELKEKALSILANMTLYWNAVQIAYRVVYTRRDIVSVSPEQKQTLDDAVTSLSNGLAAFIHDREAKAERRGRIAEVRQVEDEMKILFYSTNGSFADMQELAQYIETRIKELLAQSEQEGSEV